MTERSGSQDGVLRVSVLSATDFRLPGGTTHSMLQELRVQSHEGFSSAIMPVNSDIIRRPAPWSSPIQEALALPGVKVAEPGQPIECDVAVLRHPRAFGPGVDMPNDVRAGSVVMVANHSPYEADGRPNYDVEAIDAAVEAHFGLKPTWAPIGPVVREALAQHSGSLVIAEADWTNILAEAVREPRLGFVRDEVPVIGRHSRPQAAKWPTSSRAIRRAYPTSGPYAVRILGGAEPVQKVLGKVPSRWEVLPFGAVPAMDFLSTVDFWVYFHHPQTREAFGRAALEAMASGAVVILPHYMSATFGDAALYCEPDEVTALVDRYFSDLPAFLEQSRRGQAFAAMLGPDTHVSRLLALGASRRSATPEVRKAPARRVPRGESHGPVMYVTSNGAGMGHLTRLLSVARRVDGRKGVFASLSKGVPVVGSFGFPFEYIPSNAAVKTTAEAWNTYLSGRLRMAIDDFSPSCIVFDGTVPYKGLLDALADYAGLKVWMRRAMWKASIEGSQLGRAREFDLVIEPGEYASEYDEGVTKSARDAVVVPPITLLDRSEVLAPEAAREWLGLEEGRPAALVTLGAGNINDIKDLQLSVLSHIRTMLPDCQVVVTRPPISTSAPLPGVRTVTEYPLARFAAAFDFAVSAAGYNSFHEWMQLGLPTLWVPNLDTLTDDQHARARWAQDRNCGLMYDGSEGASLVEAITTICDSGARARIRDAIAALPDATGAQEAADVIRASLVMGGAA